MPFSATVQILLIKQNTKSKEKKKRMLLGIEIALFLLSVMWMREHFVPDMHF